VVTVASWGAWYWPAWLAVVAAGFLPAEIYGLCTNSENTLSAWVWRALRITSNQDWVKWSAADYLVFGGWVILVTWLTGHFFFGRFR
jgi:hypothetical protein